MESRLWRVFDGQWRSLRVAAIRLVNCNRRSTSRKNILNGHGQQWPCFFIIRHLNICYRTQIRPNENILCSKDISEKEPTLWSVMETTRIGPVSMLVLQHITTHMGNIQTAQYGYQSSLQIHRKIQGIAKSSYKNYRSRFQKPAFLLAHWSLPSQWLSHRTLILEKGEYWIPLFPPKTCINCSR